MIIDIKNIKEEIKQREEEQAIQEEEMLKIVQESGWTEIMRYDRLIDIFIRDIEDLALFKKPFQDVFSKQLSFMLRDEILETLIKPLFEGNIPPLMSKDIYDTMRKDMYEELRKKYIDNKESDFPF